MDFNWDVQIQCRDRITSYNVCYTKLLRNLFPADDRARQMVNHRFLEFVQHHLVSGIETIHDRSKHRDDLVEVVPVKRGRVRLATEFRLIAGFSLVVVLVVKIA